MLFLSLSFLLPFLSQVLATLPVYRIDINSNGNNNTLTLTKGQFHPITIEIHSISDSTELKLQTTYLTISDNTRFIMPQDKYYINTSDTLSVRTFIGINCSAAFTSEELSNGVQIRMDSENASFEPQYVNVTILTNPIQVNLIISDKTLGHMSYGVIYPQQALMNTNPMNIQFEVLNETYQDTLVFRNNLTIKPSFDVNHHYSQSVQFYSRSYRVTSDITGIQVQTTLTDNECYMLSNASALFELNINSTLNISNLANSDLTLETQVDDDTLYVSTIERGETSYGPLWCVLISENLNMVTDDMIVNQLYPFTPEYKDKIYYFHLTIGEQHPSFTIPLSYIDRYRKYKWTCIHKNNAADLYYSKQRTIVSTTSLNKDASVIPFGYPSCWDIHFRALNQSIVFDDNLGRYASLNVYDGSRGNYGENGCVKFTYRNISAYYPTEAQMKWNLKSLCIYSEPTCNATRFDWQNMSYTVKTKLSDVFVDGDTIRTVLGINQFDIAYMKQMDYVQLNASLVTISSNVAHNKTALQLTLNNLYAEPVECLYNLGLIEDVLHFKWGFSNKRRCVLLPGRNDDNIITLSFNADDYDNKIYAVELLCNSLPGLDVTDILDSSFKTGFSVSHSNNSGYNCTVDRKSPRCLEYTFNPNTYDDLSMTVEGIATVLSEVEQYKHKSYSEKERALIAALSQVQSAPSAIRLYPYAIQLDEYIALTDCGESQMYSQCVESVREYERIAITIIESAIFNSSSPGNSVENYLRVFAGNKTTKHVISQLLIKTLSLGNAFTALTSITCRQALSLSTALLQESSNILQLLSEVYQSDSDYAVIMHDITSLYVRSISSMQSVIAHMDVNDFISISGNAQHKFFIEDAALTPYANALSLSLTNVFLMNNITSYNSDDGAIVFKHIQLNDNNGDDGETALHELNAVVSVRVPLDKAETANVKGMAFVLYKTYPLVSVVRDNETYGEVYIGMNVVVADGVNVNKDYVLWDKVEMVYNRSSLGVNVSYCYVVKEGKLTNKNVVAVVNDDLNTLSCYVGSVGDVLVSVEDIMVDEDGEMWWVYVVLTIVIGITVGCLIACAFGHSEDSAAHEELLPLVE